MIITNILNIVSYLEVKSFPKNVYAIRIKDEKENLYERLLHICHYISMLTDGNALRLYETLQGAKK